MVANIETKTISKNAKWAGSDLNQRPPPCQGSLPYKETTRTGITYVSSCEAKSSGNHGPDFWSGFQLFLNKNNNHRGTRDRLNYAVRYAYILDRGDARQLLELKNEKRIHVMKSRITKVGSTRVIAGVTKDK